MLNTMIENENRRKGIEILAKLVFSFSIIVFNMMKLLVILFIYKTTRNKRSGGCIV